MTGNAKIFGGKRRLFELLIRRLARHLREEFWSWWWEETPFALARTAYANRKTPPGPPGEPGPTFGLGAVGPQQLLPSIFR